MVLEVIEELGFLLKGNAFRGNELMCQEVFIRKLSRRGTLCQTRLAFIAPHQFEKTPRVAHGVNFADLVGVNSGDSD